MRLLAALSVQNTSKVLHLSPAVLGDIQLLLEMQELYGSWKGGRFYKFGSSGLCVGNDGLTTALTVRALDAFSS